MQVRHLIVIPCLFALTGCGSIGGGLSLRVQPDAQNLSAGGAEVGIGIASDGKQPYCGLRLEYGDGNGDDIMIDWNNDQFPVMRSHRYTSAGKYLMKVFGKWITTHIPCQGEASIEVEVRPPAIPPAIVAPRLASAPAARSPSPPAELSGFDVDVWYRAEAGDIAAMNRLGFMYANGEGIEQSLTKAALWYGRSAQRGDSKGLYNYGYLHAHGLGVARNEATAIGLYLRAALLGNAAAMNSLGIMLVEGRGGSKSLVKGYAWFILADEFANDSQQRRDAKENQRAIARHLSVSMVTEAKAVASARRDTIRVGGAR